MGDLGPSGFSKLNLQGSCYGEKLEEGEPSIPSKVLDKRPYINLTNNKLFITKYIGGVAKLIKL